MYSLKEKVTDKLSRLFADSSNFPSSSSSSHQASPYSKQGKSWSSCLSYVIPSVGLDGSKTSNHRHDLKRGQPVSVRFNYENFDHQNDDSMDKYVDCSPSCNSKDFLKNKINDEDEAFRGSSSSSDVYEEVNSRHSSDSPNKSQLHLTNDSAFISPELNDFFESCLPNIVKGCRRVLLYSTMKHGISLRTLIRKSAELSGPCLLIVGDMQGAVFGGLLECPLKPTAKRKYQGTNQIFVFTTIYGQPRLFRPTGANRYYYLCLSDLLALGGGGSYALCLDEDLLTGTSGPSDTFGNLCLAHSPEFELKNVELWGFTYASPYLMRG